MQKLVVDDSTLGIRCYFEENKDTQALRAFTGKETEHDRMKKFTIMNNR